MSLLLTLLIGLPSGAALLLSAFLLLEVIASYRPREDDQAGPADPGPFAVIVPAHDEEAVIAETLASLAAAMRPQDRLLVVADNCSDETAAIARRHGAEVAERSHDSLRGKGYALQHGLDLLRASPPETVLFVDADCLVEQDALLRLAAAAQGENRPVQALYLMEGGGESPKARVSRFAWLMMNKIRMTGLAHLSGHCRLVGTGMGMPYALAKNLDLASGEIVEDIALALDLARDGHAPLFVKSAVVRSAFPESDAAVTTQRARWEIGALRLALRKALPLLGRSLLKGRPGAAMLALDLLIPPLVLFAALLLALFAAGVLAAWLGAWLPLAASFAALLCYAAAVSLAWWKEGRDVLPLSMAGGLLAFAAAKAGIYGKEGRRSTGRWTRTDRR